MLPYRRWCLAEGFEAHASIGGSFASDSIEDYYLTPFDLGYERSVSFDHDFIGRDALRDLDRDTSRGRSGCAGTPTMSSAPSAAACSTRQNAGRSS